MITVVQKFTYHYFSIYCVVFYSFFTHLHYKKEFLSSNSILEKSTPLPTYSFVEASSKESKIFLDLKYKNIISSYPLDTKSYTYTIDFEGKVIGHKLEHNQKPFSNLTNVTMNLNKKLLHSTLFGSIKLIKV